MNLPLPTRRAARAFTLLELLIATMAFAIVLAAINGVFYGALRLRNKTVESIEQALPLQHALATIKNDLAHLALPGGALAGSLRTTVITNFIAGQASPDFYTATGLIDETSLGSPMQKVSYALVPSGPGTVGNDLFRLVSRNLLPVAAPDPPVQQWLLSGVQHIAFTYFDGLQWREMWDSAVADPVTGQTNTLPQAVKVQLQLASDTSGPAAAQSGLVEMVVPIFAQAAGSVSAQNSGGSQ